jgi:uncharacterized glyoxalase superfamily protein PhnB
MSERQPVTPYLLYEDGEAAVAFLAEGFGFREVDRTTGGAGGIHVEMETPGGGRIYVGAPPGGFRGPAAVGRTSLNYVLVPDVEMHYARAKQAGATITEELVDTPNGDRRYTCRDPQGHEWAFATTTEERSAAAR